ncbi:hypothetical protein NMY22_g7007 [Coprinellus aureogranulatus]|nr:hypothetical protein NMY22_g7007 [Coprinellus aureogranulatus]
MAFPILQVLPIFLGTWLVWRFLKRLVVKDPLANIAGPEPSSLIAGSLPKILDKNGWAYNDELAAKYGRVAKIVGMFQRTNLLVYDPKAIQYVLVKDQHIWEQSSEFCLTNSLLWGMGLLATIGGHHRKQRKLLNPAFSTPHMRELTPLFYEVVQKLRKSIAQQVAQGAEEIEILSWMTRAALEIIGQGGFGYSFESLEPEATPHPFGIAVKTVLGYITQPDLILVRHLILPYVYKLGTSGFRRAVIKALPWKSLHELLNIVEISDRTSNEIFEQAKRSLESGADLSDRVGGGKDIMSALLKANMLASEEDRIPDSELLAQISTLAFAGMDTTSNAITRILHLLSEDQETQEKLRQEVTSAYEEHGETLDFDTLSSLPLLDAICKETLRLYVQSIDSILSYLTWSNLDGLPYRSLQGTPLRDTVLPLHKPIMTTDGEEITEIVVPKGTQVWISNLQCNRDTEIWGLDAASWKPERWLNPLPDSVIDAKIPGVYSNMMTFGAGGHACIGFRFSQLEMKVILSLLIRDFRFAPSGKKVVWLHNGIVQPTTEDAGYTVAGEKKLQLPLRERVIYTYDPKAVHSIFMKANISCVRKRSSLNSPQGYPHTWDETEEFLRTNKPIFGKGIVSTTGKAHERQRKLLVPTFSTGTIRELTPIVYNVVQRLRDSLTLVVAQGEQEVSFSLHQRGTALEIIGQSGFGYSFDSLKPNAEEHPFSCSVKNLFPVMSNPGIMAARNLLLPLVHDIGTPRFQRAVVDLVPWKKLHELRDMIDVMHNTATEILERTKKSIAKADEASGTIGRGKDILSVLVKANMDAASEDRLPEDEMLSEIGYDAIRSQRRTLAA